MVPETEISAILYIFRWMVINTYNYDLCDAICICLLD
jgi:hypothetical protein